MLDTKMPVPNSLPPRTENPYSGVVTSGNANIRLEFGRTKRITRTLLFVWLGMHHDEAVVSVKTSLEELVEAPRMQLAIIVCIQ